MPLSLTCKINLNKKVKQSYNRNHPGMILVHKCSYNIYKLFLSKLAAKPANTTYLCLSRVRLKQPTTRKAKQKHDDLNTSLTKHNSNHYICQSNHKYGKRGVCASKEFLLLTQKKKECIPIIYNYSKQREKKTHCKHLYY